MSQTSSPSASQPPNVATTILAETRAVRRLVEEAFLSPDPDAGPETDPVAAILDTQSAILKALEDVRGSLQALHLRLDRSMRSVSGGER